MSRRQLLFWIEVFTLVWSLGGVAGSVEYRRLDCRDGICYADQSQWFAGQIAAPAAKPHPAVCRVVTRDRDGRYSYGSGTLIEINDDQGLVLTAAHVVNESTDVACLFPNGERLGAKVLDADRDFDLAVLLLYAPKNTPAVPVSNAPPATGEQLWIAGYGGTQERYAQQPVRVIGPGAPSRSLPFELIECGGAAARQGDSGGPIFDANYQLAGCLFASDRATRQTVGSHCRPIRRLLERIKARHRQRKEQRRGAPPATVPIVTKPTEPPQAAASEPPPKPDEPAPVVVEHVDSEPPAEVAGPLDPIKKRIDEALESPTWPSAGATPTPDRRGEIAGGLLETLLPKLVTWGLAATGVGLPAWAVYLISRGSVRVVKRWINKRRRPPNDPPAAGGIASVEAPTPAKPTADPRHGQPISTGPTQVNFEQNYALSDAYAKELADKRTNSGASVPQEALLAQLYRECFLGIKAGAIKTLGGANVVETVEQWVTKEFMRRHGVRL